MRQTELTDIREARAATGLDIVNDALGDAQRLASAVERAPKVLIDTGRPLDAVRNFTKVLDGMSSHGDARFYALIEYVDDAQEDSG